MSSVDSPTGSDITLLLEQVARGDEAAANELVSVVYTELKRIAASQMRMENPGVTIQSTALVHEVWMKLIGNSKGPEWNSRNHFFSAAARAMRQVLVDAARARKRKKRGGDMKRVELSDQLHGSARDEELLALDEALALLAEEEPKKATLVELRYFGGFTNAQAAEQLGVSVATAERYWAYARAWLRNKMSEDDQ